MFNLDSMQEKAPAAAPAASFFNLNALQEDDDNIHSPPAPISVQVPNALIFAKPEPTKPSATVSSTPRNMQHNVLLFSSAGNDSSVFHKIKTQNHPDAEPDEPMHILSTTETAKIAVQEDRDPSPKPTKDKTQDDWDPDDWDFDDKLEGQADTTSSAASQKPDIDLSSTKLSAATEHNAIRPNKSFAEMIQTVSVVPEQLRVDEEADLVFIPEPALLDTTEETKFSTSHDLVVEAPSIEPTARVSSKADCNDELERAGLTISFGRVSVEEATAQHKDDPDLGIQVTLPTLQAVEIESQKSENWELLAIGNVEKTRIITEVAESALVSSQIEQQGDVELESVQITEDIASDGMDDMYADDDDMYDDDEVELEETPFPTAIPEEFVEHILDVSHKYPEPVLPGITESTTEFDRLKEDAAPVSFLVASELEGDESVDVHQNFHGPLKVEVNDGIAPTVESKTKTNVSDVILPTTFEQSEEKVDSTTQAVAFVDVIVPPMIEPTEEVTASTMTSKMEADVFDVISPPAFEPFKGDADSTMEATVLDVVVPPTFEPSKEVVAPTIESRMEATVVDVIVPQTLESSEEVATPTMEAALLQDIVSPLFEPSQVEIASTMKSQKEATSEPSGSDVDYKLKLEITAAVFDIVTPPTQKEATSEPSRGDVDYKLKSEIAAAVFDIVTPPTSQPAQDAVQKEDFFGFKSPTPVASSIFGYMMSASPFSDPTEPPAPSAQEEMFESVINSKPSLPVPQLSRAPVFETFKPNTDGSDQDMIPASVLDTYAIQMQRMQDYHHSEIQEIQKKYEQELLEALASLNHDACVAERDGLSERFMGKLRGKEEQLQEVMRVNEGLELRIDALKRELTGTKSILNEKEKSIGTVSSAREKELKLLEQKVKEIRESEGVAKADIHQLRDQLKAARSEIERSDEAYGALKARVKVVATELKDRRAECRTLGLSLEELIETNEHLRSKMANLESQLGDRDRNQTEKDEEMDHLKDKVRQLEEELKEADKKIQERGMVGEKALAAYKKKAQTSMSAANARTAAAIQAKEEADIESQGARSAADEAIQRAKEAEAAGKAMLQEAREYVKEMEDDRSELLRKAQDTKDELDKAKQALLKSNTEVECARSSKEELAAELNDLQTELQLERGLSFELQQEVRDLQKRSNDLYEEVETLRDELRRQATAAFMTKSLSVSDDHEVGTDGDGKASLTSAETSETESTIIMLQCELKDANQAIKELKEILRTTIEQQPQNRHDNNDLKAGTSAGQETSPEVKLAGAPLFYAMEKQVELNTARSEINRLANLLGDAQSEKMEAYEAVQEMRKHMEEAEARLRRYEKLGPSNPRGSKTQEPMHAMYQDVSPKHRTNGANIDSSDGNENYNSASVNLEYLKNVMMSFFGAKTLAEKKALLSVVGSVLCLTPEEQHRAAMNIESSGSLENAGISLFENVGAQLGFKLV